MITSYHSECSSGGCLSVSPPHPACSLAAQAQGCSGGCFPASTSKGGASAALGWCAKFHFDSKKMCTPVRKNCAYQRSPCLEEEYKYLYQARQIQMRR